MTNKEALDAIIERGLNWPIWIEGVEPDPDVGLGLSNVWQLSNNHPLFWAGVVHDLEYQVKKEPSSKNADSRFLSNCKKLAGENELLILQSYLFFALASIVGYFRW